MGLAIRYTNSELTFLDENKDKSVKYLAEVLKRSESSVRYKLWELYGLRDSSGSLEDDSKGYNQKLKFAVSKGYKNVGDAVNNIGPNTFRQSFKNWVKNR